MCLACLLELKLFERLPSIGRVRYFCLSYLPAASTSVRQMLQSRKTSYSRVPTNRQVFPSPKVCGAGLRRAALSSDRVRRRLSHPGKYGIGNKGMTQKNATRTEGQGPRRWPGRPQQLASEVWIKDSHTCPHLPVSGSPTQKRDAGVSLSATPLFLPKVPLLRPVVLTGKSNGEARAPH